jgi:hypothetical protein
MSIQTIIGLFVVVSGLSLGLAGASWAEDLAAKDEGETASAETAPPANADEGATADEDESGDAKDAKKDDAED